MTKLLLDTTFLIDADRSSTALDGSIDDEDDVAIAAITVAELLVGVELADSRHHARRQRFVEEVMETIRVIDYDVGVAAGHARLLAATRRQGRPRGAHDLMIAATALATERVVVSADPLAFAELPGVEIRSHRR